MASYLSLSWMNGATVLSTNDPKPSLYFVVIILISAAK